MLAIIHKSTVFQQEVCSICGIIIVNATNAKKIAIQSHGPDLDTFLPKKSQSKINPFAVTIMNFCSGDAHVILQVVLLLSYDHSLILVRHTMFTCKCNW